MRAPFLCTLRPVDEADAPAPLTRRGFLALAGGALAVPLVAGCQPTPPVPAVAVGPGLSIYPREAWALGRPDPGPLPHEQLGDVRFLLVHHSASSNDYRDGGAEIRAFHSLHTGPERGWPDVAYNFFIDRFGRVWEGRTGSLEKPVKGDATGGSQGYALLCCLIGDFRSVRPPDAAIRSLTRLLAWLSVRYDISTAPGSTTSFRSRGSNRWPAGAMVTTATIAGHRDMSLTACPGNAAYWIVRQELPRLVTAAAPDYR